MAQAGGGRYVYVAKPDQIPSALRRELGDLLSVVAQNVKFKMELPPGVEVNQVFGREEPLNAGVLEVPLGDLTSGEERVLLVKCHKASDPAPGGPIELGAVLTFDDVAQARRIDSKQTMAIERTAAAGGNAAKTNGPVLAYARLAAAAAVALYVPHSRALPPVGIGGEGQPASFGNKMTGFPLQKENPLNDLS